MTVKCLNDYQKGILASRFSHGMSIAALAQVFGVSRRTVIRTLEEMGIEPGIKRRPKIKKPTPLPPGPVPSIPTVPWWKRIIPWMKNVSERRFTQ